MANKDTLRSLLMSGRLLALSLFGSLAAHGYSLDPHAPSRGLQTASNAIYIKQIQGTALVSGQENAAGLLASVRWIVGV